MDGIIVVNKPKGCTSHDVVYKVRWIVKEKVGHTGTLDPLATGVLPLLIGKGTLCSKYLINHDKEYQVSLKLGISTEKQRRGTVQEFIDTLEILQTIGVDVSKLTENDTIETLAKKAIKVKGKKLYEYARRGEKVEVPKREIEIYNMELIGINKLNKEIEFKVSCSKGTYIRSLCTDIAKALGTIGYMSGLERLKVGEFTLKNSIVVNDSTDREVIEKNIITVEELFKDKGKIELDSKKLLLFLNGVKLSYENIDGVYRIYNLGKFIGLGVVKNKFLKRDIVL